MWGSRGKSRIEDSAPAYLFAGSTLALAVVLYLAYASFFILKEVCPLCVDDLRRGHRRLRHLRRSELSAHVQSAVAPLRDIRVLVATPLALVVALLFVAGAASARRVLPARTAAAGGAQPPAAALNQEQRSEFERWWDVSRSASKLPFANDGAKVLSSKFTDFQCPPCRQTYFAYEPILAKYKDRPKDVKYLLQHLPARPELQRRRAAAGARGGLRRGGRSGDGGAEGHGRQADDWFFVHQDELSPATVRTRRQGRRRDRGLRRAATTRRSRK